MHVGQALKYFQHNTKVSQLVRAADTISYKILRLVLLFYTRNQFEKAILNISNAYRAWGAKMLKRMMDFKKTNNKLGKMRSAVLLVVIGTLQIGNGFG